MTSEPSVVPSQAVRSVRPVVVVGEFDGLHLGHRDLVAAARSVAEPSGRRLAAVVLDASVRTSALTTIEDRVRGLLLAGASMCHVLRVGELEADNARVAHEVVTRLDPSSVVMACPPDPVGREPVSSLAGWFGSYGVPVRLVDRRRDDEGSFTSDRVRQALIRGDVTAAAVVLGAAYEIGGDVVHGQKLGRTIGFPTANIPPPRDRCMPAPGVYAGYSVTDDGGVWDAAVNVGTRPSVDSSNELLIEAHLLDFDGDLYGRRVRVGFVHALRAECRFDSLDGLTAQLHRDVATVARLSPSTRRRSAGGRR